jgi:DNA mismatch repair protein MLH3
VADAIMFGDRLTVDQCERLVHQLGKTRFPFMCAHGRPSLVPIMKLGTTAEVVASSKRNTDWIEWTGKVRL